MARLSRQELLQQKTKANIRWAVRVGAVGVLGGIGYALYWRYKQPSGEAAHPLGSVFDVLAPRYDDCIGKEEFLMWLPLVRWWKLREVAKGNVLEISAGTGRNFPYYHYPDIDRLTITDVSRPMLTEAEKKYFDDLRYAGQYETKIKFAISDAHCMVQDGPATTSGPQNQPPSKTPRQSPKVSQPSQPTASPSTPATQCQDEDVPTHIHLPPPQAPTRSLWSLMKFIAFGPPKRDEEAVQACTAAHTFDMSEVATCCSTGRTPQGEVLTRFPAGTFDCVVDTFGLCSHANPVKVLKQAAKLLKPDGKILLIEHGRSYYAWLNNNLDKGCQRHREKWGCFWNRDIMAIVKEAGLNVEYSTRWHFGTTYIIVATLPKPETDADAAKATAR